MAFTNYPSGQPSAGTLLQRGLGNSPESFKTVANVSNINGPQASRSSIETTSHSTVPSGGGPLYRSYVPGPIDPGAIAFDVFIKTDADDYRELASNFANGTFVDWRIVEPDQLSTVIAFSGFITKFNLSADINGVTKAGMEIRTSGVIEFFA